MCILAYFIICFATPFNKFLKNRSIENQINYLSHILDQGYDNQLQSRYPEGKVFSNALLALSVIEYCDKNKDFKVENAEIVDKCLDRLLSKNALRIFPTDIKPTYGMFYNGWVNNVLVSYSKSQLFLFSNNQQKIIDTSQTIESELNSTQKDSIKILDSYTGSHYPADNLIGIVSLQDSITKHLWLDKIFSETLHPKKLINHAESDQSIARGSSSALIVYCLNKSRYPDIIQYQNKYKETFVDQYFGIQLVKENENGSNNSDFDSGPVIFGYGAAATIMNIKTQASIGDKKHSKITWAFFNTISIPLNFFYSKHYLFQQEPMYDLFMLWAAVEL